jgi:hypothetical protein
VKQARPLRHFCRDRNGGATVEFVLLFPLYFSLFLMTVESGIFMFRHVALDRSLDLAVREVRLNTANPPNYEQFRELLCANMMTQMDCEETVQIEMRPVDTATWQGVSDVATCRDVRSEIDAYDEEDFVAGTSNELMMIQVCGMYRPMFPLTPFGLRLQRQPDGTYAVVVKSGFVSEPT